MQISRKIFAIAIKHHKKFQYLVLFIFVFLIVVANFRYIAGNDHWKGSEAAYDYWTVNRFQWGKEIVQNVGPLAFIHFPLTFNGFLDRAKTISDFVLSGVLALLVVHAFARLPNNILKSIFVSILCYFFSRKLPGPWSFPVESSHYLLMLLSFYAMFTLDASVPLVVLSALLGISALGKGMFLFTSIIGILGVTVSFFLRGKKGKASMVLAAYAISLFTAWTAAGQQIQNFPAFLLGSMISLKKRDNKLSHVLLLFQFYMFDLRDARLNG